MVGAVGGRASGAEALGGPRGGPHACTPWLRIVGLATTSPDEPSLNGAVQQVVPHRILGTSLMPLPKQALGCSLRRWWLECPVPSNRLLWEEL